MSEEIEKSTNIIIDETKKKIMQILIQAKLPALISEMIVKEILVGVSMQAQQCLQQDKSQYQKKLQEVEKKAGAKDGSKERTGK